MSPALAKSVISLENPTSLRDRFEGASAGPQLVALVSPTCAVCLDGVAMVLGALEEPAGAGFQVHLIWTPVLGDDSLAAATAVAAARQRERVGHYWDVTRSLSAAAHTVLNLGAFDRSTAWDVYLVYRAGTQWHGELPVPASWLHQLRIDAQPNLDAESLRSAMQVAIS